MSSDHHVCETPTEDTERPKACPHCRASGPFDRRGGFCREGIIKRTGKKQEYIEYWARHRCPSCDEVFGTRERSVVGDPQENSDAGE